MGAGGVSWDAEFWAEVTRAVDATLPEEWPQTEVDLDPRLEADTPGLSSFFDRPVATNLGHWLAANEVVFSFPVRETFRRSHLLDAWSTRPDDRVEVGPGVVVPVLARDFLGFGRAYFSLAPFWNDVLLLDVWCHVAAWTVGAEVGTGTNLEVSARVRDHLARRRSVFDAIEESGLRGGTPDQIEGWLFRQARVRDDWEWGSPETSVAFALKAALLQGRGAGRE